MEATKMRTCKQCGKVKSIAEYRHYYGGRKGHYTTCKACEKINNREKYLASKQTLSECEAEEFDKIHLLWERQMSLGLRPPIYNGRSAALEGLDALLDEYTAVCNEVNYAANKLHNDNVKAGMSIPMELAQWLTATLDKEPDYYLDEVYDRLVGTYRPVLGVDKATMMPKHDDTYKAILDRILERFNEYEDKYYEEE